MAVNILKFKNHLLYPFFSVSSNTTLKVGENVIVDSSSLAITITLPPSPQVGDEVRIIDGAFNASVNNILIDRNGMVIDGDAENMIIDVDGAAFGLVYYSASRGWVLTER